MTEYTKIDDYTLMETKYGMGASGELYTIFNFQSRQMTIIYQNTCGQEAGVSAATQNFRDVEGQDYIEMAKEKLVELGGLPGQRTEPSPDDCRP